MITLRIPGAVSAKAPALEGLLKAWGNVSGSATPSLDSPSFGISSITDAGVGLMDVTWQTPFASGTSYAMAVTCQTTNGATRVVALSTTITGTSVRLNVGLPTATLADLGAGGLHFTAVGI